MRQLPFSEARENLTSVLDDVEATGQPITILRRGKPVAVVISQEMFERHVRPSKKSRWRLIGSMKAAPGVDIDAAIAMNRKAFRESQEERSHRHKRDPR